MTKPDEPVIFVRWMQFLEWLLPATEKFPKRVRFTFADDKPTLHLWLAQIRGYLHDRLALQLKEPATLLAPVTEGLPFLGFRIYPGLIRLNRRGLRRFRRQVHGWEKAYRAGGIGRRGLGRVRCQPVRPRRPRRYPDAAAANGVRLSRRGLTGHGLQPGHPRRRLEQRRRQLPFGVPQQERPDNRNNNLGFRLSSTCHPPDGCRPRTAIPVHKVCPAPSCLCRRLPDKKHPAPGVR